MYSPLLIFGLRFSKDESFLRWLFLERARLHKMHPTLKPDYWFADTREDGALHRKAFFEGLKMKYVSVPEYAEIYENLECRG